CSIGMTRRGRSGLRNQRTPGSAGNWRGPGGTCVSARSRPATRSASPPSSTMSGWRPGRVRR
ncbi:MAG: hypothetical protein AVDCRST_MAG18-2801, partial [uncultured Thermomicrobiales bacterium]